MKAVAKLFTGILAICLSGSLLMANPFSEKLYQIVNGENSNTIVNESLTRGEAAKLIVDTLGYQAIADDLAKVCSFKDVTVYKGEIELVKAFGIMSGTGENQFSPEAKLTDEQGNMILQKLQNKLNKPLKWQHACYAIASNSQRDWIKGYDAISFGWAELGYNESQDSFEVSTTNGVNFKLPQGFESVVDEAKAHGVETYLMVYFEDKDGLANHLLSNQVNKKAVIEQIVNLSKETRDNNNVRGFDGITIDFEQFYSSELKVPYINFLKELKEALAEEGKKLNVAVQPTLYFKGYDYKAIGQACDHLILMAHDYGSKKLTELEMQQGITRTPLTPINEVYKALEEASRLVEDKSKISLQFSFGSLQWQTEEGVVLHQQAYTPTYDKIVARLDMMGTVRAYDMYYQNTYATYEENGIKNIIWYEDEASIRAKLDLAKLLGINSISYWRLGLLPKAFSPFMD